ncbi:hypothetical protein EfmAA94_25370 [Enterococcus faecium]|nr:hypothetical protein EfmAA94_25370 [Enterococcus faecium]
MSLKMEWLQFLAIYSTMINQPVQNVSFVTTSLGFVSTRESLFYTNNGGRSFKESVLSIPENYQTGG